MALRPLSLVFPGLGLHIDNQLKAEHKAEHTDMWSLSTRASPFEVNVYRVFVSPTAELLIPRGKWGDLSSLHPSYQSHLPGRALRRVPVRWVP